MAGVLFFNFFKVFFYFPLSFFLPIFHFVSISLRVQIFTFIFISLSLHFQLSFSYLWGAWGVLLFFCFFIFRGSFIFSFQVHIPNEATIITVSLGRVGL